MIRFARAACLLFIALPAQGKPVDDVAFSDITTIRELFIGHQLRWLPLVPPSENRFVQPYDMVLPIAWKSLPRELMKNLVGTLSEDLIPTYQVVMWDDPVTLDTVFSSVDGLELYRISGKKDYDPYAWLKNTSMLRGYDFVQNPLYSQTRVATRMIFVPSEFYDDYLIADAQSHETEATVEAVAIAPMAMMSMSYVPPVFELDILMSSSIESDSIILKSTVSGEQYEVYYSPSLDEPRWTVAHKRIWGSVSKKPVWMGIRVGDGLNGKSGFYNAGSMLDEDGDGLSSSYEITVLGTDPLLSDSDIPPNGINDGDEDFDGDGLINKDEYLGVTIGYSSSPLHADSDGDGVADGPVAPYLPLTEGPDQFPLDPSGAVDTDNDGFPDDVNGESTSYPPLGEDLDDDNDRLWDTFEIAQGLDPKDSSDGLGDIDSDRDGLGDLWEAQFEYSPAFSNDVSIDSDTDGLTLIEEYQAGTDPRLKDSDHDGLNDGDEVRLGFNPLAFDAADRDIDQDGLTVLEEAKYKTHPLYSDTDGDQLMDGDEIKYGTLPLKPDTDGDGLFDGEEIHQYNTDPNLRDSDGDGILDSIEMLPEQKVWGTGAAKWRMLGK